MHFNSSSQQYSLPTKNSRDHQAKPSNHQVILTKVERHPLSGRKNHLSLLNISRDSMTVFLQPSHAILTKCEVSPPFGVMNHHFNLQFLFFAI